MDRVEVIQKCLDAAGGKTYLEIGLEKGLTIQSVRAKKKWGVDPAPGFDIPTADGRAWLLLPGYGRGLRFFKMTSDEFFRKKAFTLFWNGIDTAFVDGLHTYEQSLKDVLNCVKYLRRGGTIVLHDCNPTDYHMAYPAKSHAEALLARQPDPRKAWCGEVWKTVVHLRSHFSNLNVCVLDCDYGIGLIRRGVSGPPLSFSQAEIRNMTYEELAARRAELLNLKAPEYLSSFLNGG